MSHKLTPPPLEDLSHLNPPSSRKQSDAARKAWGRMPPAEKARRARLAAAAGKRSHINGRIDH